MNIEKNWKSWATMGSVGIIISAALLVSTYENMVILPRLTQSQIELNAAQEELADIKQQQQQAQFAIMLDTLEAVTGQKLTEEERQKLWAEEQEALKSPVPDLSI